MNEEESRRPVSKGEHKRGLTIASVWTFLGMLATVAVGAIAFDNHYLSSDDFYKELDHFGERIELMESRLIARIDANTYSNVERDIDELESVDPSSLSPIERRKLINLRERLKQLSKSWSEAYAKTTFNYEEVTK